MKAVARVLILLLFVCIADQAPPLHDGDELNYHFLKGFFSRTRCELNFIHYLGCLRGLDALLETWPGNPRLDFKDSRFTLAFPRAPQPAEAPVTVLRQYREERRQRMQKWRAVFLNHKHLPLLRVLTQSRKYNKTRDLENESALDAINSYISMSVDAHGSVQKTGLFENELKGSVDRYQGVGLNLFKLNDWIFVERVIDHSPASKLKLKPEDAIEKVDDIPTSILSAQQVEDKLNNASFSHKVQIVRGNHRFTIRLKPSALDLPDLEVVRRSKDVLEIKLNTFIKSSLCEQMTKTLKKASRQNIKYLVLDLRNNGGGLVEQALCLASEFVGPHHDLLQLRTLQGQTVQLNSDDNQWTLPKNINVAILVNSRTASAAEIFSGILQDYRRAVIIGERTFGKGSIQTMQPWILPGYQISQTVAVYELPGPDGLYPHSPQYVGLEPDVKVPADKIHFREADYSPVVLKPLDDQIENSKIIAKINHHWRRKWQQCGERIKRTSGLDEFAGSLLTCAARNTAIGYLKPFGKGPTKALSPNQIQANSQN